MGHLANRFHKVKTSIETLLLSAEVIEAMNHRLRFALPLLVALMSWTSAASGLNLDNLGKGCLEPKKPAPCDSTNTNRYFYDPLKNKCKKQRKSKNCVIGGNSFSGKREC